MSGATADKATLERTLHVLEEAGGFLNELAANAISREEFGDLMMGLSEANPDILDVRVALDEPDEQTRHIKRQLEAILAEVTEGAFGT